jgi:hypothetical protein
VIITDFTDVIFLYRKMVLYYTTGICFAMNIKQKHLHMKTQLSGAVMKKKTSKSDMKEDKKQDAKMMKKMKKDCK